MGTPAERAWKENHPYRPEGETGSFRHARGKLPPEETNINNKR
ncbi:hypothetical protein [Salimicrobium flavidum]|nr:hypothetical protein [Salimicrobium flavidum]